MRSNAIARGLSIALFLIGSHPFASAQNQYDSYPTKDIKIIAPFPPGGAADSAARIVAEGIGSEWKVSVVVENAPGAAGGIGTSKASRAKPDGYTILLGTGAALSVLPHVTENLRYSPLDDFEGVSLVADFPTVLLVRSDLPVNSVRQLIDLLNTDPTKYKFSSSGYGSSLHLAGELFKQKAGVNLTHVPFNGAGPALTALLGGHVDIMFDTLSNAYPYIEDGRVRALGVGGLERVATAKQFPTISETIPEFEVTTWASLMVPKGTAQTIKQKLSEKVREVLSKPDVIRRLERVGASPKFTTPEEMDVIAKESFLKWGEVVKKAGLTLK